MMNIVILDGYASNPGDLNWDLLEQLGNVTVYPRTNDDEKIERAKDADIILINKVQMDAETLAQLPKLKYIGIQATGYNVVDIEAAKRQGIVVTNIPAYSTDSVPPPSHVTLLGLVLRKQARLPAPYQTGSQRLTRMVYWLFLIFYPFIAHYQMIPIISSMPRVWLR